MKKITLLFLSLGLFGYSQNTYVPDDNFEQALIDQGYDSGALDDYVPTANINTLTNLSMSSKDISDLTGIEDFTALSNLLCWNNNLTELDLSQNLALSSLKCNANQLTSLDLSNNTALTNLKCYGNLLTSLDLSTNINLDYLRCENNQLSELNVQNGNNSIITFFNASGNANLNCINVDNVAYSDTNWTTIDTQTSFNEDCSSALSINEVDFNASISVYPNPTKNRLNIAFETTVDVILVYNILGELVAKTKNQNYIDLAQLETGIYLVKIQVENNTIVKKILHE